MGRRKQYPEHIEINITEEDILSGVCGNSRNCMIGLAVQRELGLIHGYVKVDATGVKITRRPDYREKSDLSDRAVNMLCAHDTAKRLGLNPLDYVKPAKIKLHFRKTTKIAPKATPERKAQINKARRLRAANGNPDRISYKRDRMAGKAIGPQLAARLKRMKDEVRRIKAAV